MSDVHLHEVTAPADRLGEIVDEVFAEVDRMALRVGELLVEARALDPDGFASWVETALPFGADKARRLIAIHLAYRDLPESTLADMPRPWQALYALRNISPPQLEAAIAQGEIGPDTTVSAAQKAARRWSGTKSKTTTATPRLSAADLRAGKLMDCHPDELDDNVLTALRRWLGRRSDPTSS